MKHRLICDVCQKPIRLNQAGVVEPRKGEPLVLHMSCYRKEPERGEA